MCVHSLITCLQLKKMSVMLESVHVATTFQLIEMSSITTPSQKQFRIFAQVPFFKWFLGKISAILPICIMKKFNLEVTCKRNCFGYWNWCKRLPNFINVAALSRTFVLLFITSFWLLVGFVALRPKSTAMVIAGRSVHLTTLFPGQA